MCYIADSYLQGRYRNADGKDGLVDREGEWGGEGGGGGQIERTASTYIYNHV